MIADAEGRTQAADDLFAQAFEIIITVNIGENQREFVTTNARQGVELATQLSEATAGFAQNTIANLEA